MTQYFYSPYGSGSGGSGGYADGNITSFDLIISDQAGNNFNISGLFGFFSLATYLIELGTVFKILLKI